MGYAFHSQAGRRIVLLVVLWATAAVHPAGVRALFAQESGGTFGRYSGEHGLSHPTVLAIWQDREGYMWFATEDGLNRFDGHRFTIYRHDPADSTSLSENWVTALAEDDAGNLWVGTEHRGLNRFDPVKKTFTRLPYGPPDSSKGIPRGDVNGLVYRDGVLWIAVWGGGLSRLDLRTGTYLHYDRRTERFADFISNDLLCLYVDRAGYVWAGRQEYGLVRVDPRTHTFHHERYRPGDRTALSSDRIRSIYEDREGNLWIATSGGGLNRYDRTTGTFKRYVHDPNDPRSISHDVVWSVFEDSRGNLWAGTFGGGLNRFDRATETFTRFRHDPNDPTSLPSDAVLSIYEDRSGLLWFGTDAGIATYNPASEHILHFGHRSGDPTSLSHNDVLSLLERPKAPDTFWIGTGRGGLNLLDLETRRITRIDLSTADPVKGNRLIVSALAEDTSGTVWVGTQESGLVAYTPRTGTVVRYAADPTRPGRLHDPLVYSVMVDREQYVWIGTNTGLTRLDPATGVFTRFDPDMKDPTGLNNAIIFALHQDRQGRIWAGTQHGLFRIIPDTGKTIRYAFVPGDSTSLSHNYIYSIYESRDGALWIGTYGGLNRFDPETGRFRHYTVRDGLASDIIYGITGGPNGTLWMTTSRGLSRLTPQTGQIINYGTADGLPNTRFNRHTLARSRRGELLVGGPNGLDVFHPNTLQHKRYRPSLVITSFRKFGTVAETDLRDDIPVRLSHKDTYFSFDFALLDFSNPAEHQFRYRLDGFDAGWQRVSGPIGSAHYQNDGRFGTYFFRVQAVDSKGRSNERRLMIVIVPPWWRTPWFRSLCLFGAIALAGTTLAYGYRRKQQELAEKRRMLSESREQERHFLARELHDVPLQNLYSVRHRLEVIAREVPLNGQASDLEAAQRLLEQTAEDLRRICGELRPPSLGPFGLSKAIRSHLRTFEEAHPDIVVEFDLTPDAQRLPEPIRLALFRIYQGTLSNVARHAEARTVRVRFELTDEVALLEIEDDGKGFVVPKNWMEMARRQHYGLLGIAEWAESIRGTLTVRSAPGEGSLVQVRVPLCSERRFPFLPPAFERIGVFMKDVS